MFMAVWITMLNALGSSSFINAARINVADGVPLGLLEVSIAVAFAYAVFRGGALQNFHPRLRVHPLVFWLAVLWIAAWLSGAIGSFGTSSDTKWIMVAMREYAMVPICIFIGYRALATPRSSLWMCYWILIGAVGNTIFLFLQFRSGAGELTSASNLNALRQIDFMTPYSVVGCLLFAYSALSGLRLIRPWLATVLSAFCMTGALSSVSRTTLLSLVIGFVSLFVILPPKQRVQSLMKTLLFLPVIAVTLYVGMEVATAVTGKDFQTIMMNQVRSVLPESSDDGVHKEKAWDSRLPSLLVELEIFFKNPLIGGGFSGVGEEIVHGGTNYGAFNHNSWTAVAAATGMIGLTALGLLVFSMIVVGFRMTREAVDQSSVGMGAVGFIVGVNTFIFAMCTMVFTARGAMYFGLMSGLFIRAREIQETSRQMAMDESFLPLQVGHPEYDEFVDTMHHEPSL